MGRHHEYSKSPYLRFIEPRLEGWKYIKQFYAEKAYPLSWKHTRIYSILADYFKKKKSGVVGQRAGATWRVRPTARSENPERPSPICDGRKAGNQMDRTCAAR